MSTSAATSTVRATWTIRNAWFSRPELTIGQGAKSYRPASLGARRWGSATWLVNSKDGPQSGAELLDGRALRLNRDRFRSRTNGFGPEIARRANYRPRSTWSAT